MEPPDLPSCLDLTESQRADCYLASSSDRQGYVVYSSYRGCMNSWLAAPGFMLLPTWGLAVIYLLILLYLFVGVAHASDKFMASIEVICSATRKAKRRCPVTGQKVAVRVPVWNWVVANLSLMAVGSSAPEILLAVVESILRLGRPAGELGASTIVGSACFNLVMIAAVCTAALPTGVVKHVKHLRVFITTCIISLWAYVWMLVVYLWWTPGEVTVVEALLTLLQFVLLLVIGWAVDVKVWKWFHRGRLYPDKGLPPISGPAADAAMVIESPPPSLADPEAGRAAVSVQFTTMGSAAAAAASGKLGAGEGGEAEQQQLWPAWKQQFIEAIEYDSTASEDGEEPGGWLGLVSHFWSMFWKLCTATTPPAWWLGGWPCFCANLAWIIAQVIVLDEVATLLGCVLGLSPLVIGSSLVALGTSLPDTFCSRTAALKDSHADAAVGNVTGSNAANVFLGLGLPWLISSCYYAARGERFCSDSGALAFSVLVYSGVAVVWLAVLFLRRVYAGGELGANSAVAKWGLFVGALGLWGLYLVLTGLVADGKLDDSWIAIQAGSCSRSVA